MDERTDEQRAAGSTTDSSTTDTDPDTGASETGGAGGEAGSEPTSGSDDRPRAAWGSFAEIQDAVSGLVDSAIRNVAPASGRFPRYDLIDVPEEGYVILFDMPGLAKSDVEVSANAGEVTVEGKRSRPVLPDGAEVQRSERTYGRFRRVVRVSGDVDVAAVRARMENGVLEVRLPRRRAGDAQRIEVD
ncbi:MAG: Hsp20/alpha crystallin family protein [Gemmatimonadota bacterium]|nr:Hsp20/alpha crystallin family protein [Gemmatimonadota bacterium]